MHLWYQFQNPTLLCSLLHLQVFQKTWPLTFTMKSLRFKLVLNFYRYLYGINFKLLCYLVLEFLQTYICTLPTGPAGLWCCFLKIIRLLCANRNNLSFLRETRMFKNVMLKPHVLLKKALGKFLTKTLCPHLHVHIIRFSNYVVVWLHLA